MVDGERQLFFVRERCCGAKKKEEEEKKREKKSGKRARGKWKRKSVQVTQNMDDDKQNKKNSNANPFFFALKDANGCYPSPGRPP